MARLIFLLLVGSVSCLPLKPQTKTDAEKVLLAPLKRYLITLAYYISRDANRCFHPKGLIVRTFGLPLTNVNIVPHLGRPNITGII